tara:strand:+ start:38321 stop:38524 length:204 start_codon:yes stop_codon:yes gene_type:complete
VQSTPPLVVDRSNLEEFFPPTFFSINLQASGQALAPRFFVLRMYSADQPLQLWVAGAVGLLSLEASE